MAEVRSVVRHRGRTFGVVAALAASMGLASAPTALGVDGDPIAGSAFLGQRTSIFDSSKTFERQLKRNGVKMKPKTLTLRRGDVDPTTGAADLRLGKITFKKGKEKVVYNNVKATLPGKVKGSAGNLFKFTAPTVARRGFGAELSGIKVKFLKGAAKKLNKKLELGSLHKGSAGTLAFSYQPQTVKVVGGATTVLSELFTGGSVSGKLQAHCIDAFSGQGVVPISPAVQFTPEEGGLAFTFPVTGGTISPAANAGVVQHSGGIRLQGGNISGFGMPPACPNYVDRPPDGVGPEDFYSWLEQTNLALNYELLNIQAEAVIGGATPGCWSANYPPTCGVFPGPKGIAIVQTLDASNLTVNADPSNRTITINGAAIKNNALTSTVLGQGVGNSVALARPPAGPNGDSTVFPALGVFPNASCVETPDFSPGPPPGVCGEATFPPPTAELKNCSPNKTCRPDPAQDFAEGDVFGTAFTTLQVR